MKLTIERIVIVALLFLAVFFGVRTCSVEKKFAVFEEQSEQKFVENNAKLINTEERIYQGDLIIAQNSKRIQELVDSVDYLRKIKSVTRVITKTEIDTIKIPFEVPVYIEQDLNTYLQVPLSFSKRTNWYSINGQIKKNGIFFDSLTYKNEFIITTGEEDHGNLFKNLFKDNGLVVTLRDNNPYSRTETLYQTIVKDYKSNFHIGPQAGVYFFDGRVQYSVGIGVTYSVISF